MKSKQQMKLICNLHSLRVWATYRPFRNANRIPFSGNEQEMRAAFEAEAKQINRARLLMSAAVSSGRGTVETAYQIPQLGQWVKPSPQLHHGPTSTYNTLLREEKSFKNPLKAHCTKLQLWLNVSMRVWETGLDTLLLVGNTTHMIHDALLNQITGYD